MIKLGQNQSRTTKSINFWIDFDQFWTLAIEFDQFLNRFECFDWMAIQFNKFYCDNADSNDKFRLKILIKRCIWIWFQSKFKTRLIQSPKLITWGQYRVAPLLGSPTADAKNSLVIAFLRVLSFGTSTKNNKIFKLKSYFRIFVKLFLFRILFF